MKIPFWKRWLSHFKPITIETARGEVNPWLEVAMHRGRFQLLSNNSIYSWDDLYVNYVRAFELFDFKKFQPKEVLVLGLGLGSVPFILEKKIWTKTAFHLRRAGRNRGRMGIQVHFFAHGKHG